MFFRPIFLFFESRNISFLLFNSKLGSCWTVQLCETLRNVLDRWFLNDNLWPNDSYIDFDKLMPFWRIILIILVWFLYCLQNIVYWRPIGMFKMLHVIRNIFFSTPLLVKREKGVWDDKITIVFLLFLEDIGKFWENVRFMYLHFFPSETFWHFSQLGNHC